MDVILAPTQASRIVQYELTDFEWAAIGPFLPNKPRGVPQVNDRRVLNGIFWVLRSGARHGAICRRPLVPVRPATIASFAGRGGGVSDHIMDALAAAHDAAVQMIETSLVHVHQHGACIAGNIEQTHG